MFNISFLTCIRKYIGHKSLEDQTFSRQNGCLTPSYSVTQPSDLGFWFSRSSLVFIYFGQNVTRTLGHVIIWQIVTRTQSYVIFKFFKICNFYSINEWNYFVLYLVIIIFSFSFFLYKKKWRLHTTYQKERCLKRYPNLFFEGRFSSRSLTGQNFSMLGNCTQC